MFKKRISSEEIIKIAQMVAKAIPAKSIPEINIKDYEFELSEVSINKSKILFWLAFPALVLENVLYNFSQKIDDCFPRTFIEDFIQKIWNQAFPYGYKKLLLGVLYVFSTPFIMVARVYNGIKNILLQESINKPNEFEYAKELFYALNYIIADNRRIIIYDVYRKAKTIINNEADINNLVGFSKDQILLIKNMLRLGHHQYSYEPYRQHNFLNLSSILLGKIFVKIALLLKLEKNHSKIIGIYKGNYFSLLNVDGKIFLKMKNNGLLEVTNPDVINSNIDLNIEQKEALNKFIDKISQGSNILINKPAINISKYYSDSESYYRVIYHEYAHHFMFYELLKRNQNKLNKVIDLIKFQFPTKIYDLKFVFEYCFRWAFIPFTKIETKLKILIYSYIRNSLPPINYRIEKTTDEKMLVVNQRKILNEYICNYLNKNIKKHECFQTAFIVEKFAYIAEILVSDEKDKVPKKYVDLYQDLGFKF